MTLKAAIFDWDGTITDSNNIKTEAFVELFQSACPQAAGYIREYQQNRGGISRFEKFRHYIRHFFHREASAAELEDFGRRYAALCRPKLLNAPFIPGAVETLRKLSLEKIPVFIVTGSPATEIRELAATRNLLPLIHHIYGSPPTKDVLLAVLLAENRLVPEETVFFGDAPADCEAARINQIPFIGICPDGKTSPFPPHTTVVSAIDLDI
ncbi:MAG: HAD family hydrolase [Alphaproteobacteria bacterium]